MSLSQELERLAALHAQGQLSDEEFRQAKARLLGEDFVTPGAARPAQGFSEGLNQLARSRDDRWLGGVCGGLADATGLASWLWRLLFIVTVGCGGFSAIAYLLMWLLLPEQRRLRALPQ